MSCHLTYLQLNRNKTTRKLYLFFNKKKIKVRYVKCLKFDVSYSISHLKVKQQPTIFTMNKTVNICCWQMSCARNPLNCHQSISISLWSSTLCPWRRSREINPPHAHNSLTSWSDFFTSNPIHSSCTLIVMLIPKPKGHCQEFCI